MANRWKGNFIIAVESTSDGTNYTGKANGSWGLNSQLQQKQAGLWAKAVGVPSAPTIGTAVPAAGSATVSFTASSDNGGASLTYTATSSPDGFTNTGSVSPISVSGLTNGTAYTFTVKATNTLGYTSVASSPSNSVTPTADVIAIGTQVSPFINAYLWGNGYGSKFANPSTIPVSAGMVTGLCFNKTNTAIVAAFSYGTNAPSEYLTAHAFSASTGFGSKYPAPATTPTGESRKCMFSPNGSYLAVAHSSSPYITVYNWSNGFGTKISNPGTLPAGVLCYGVSFSPASNALGYLSNTEGGVYTWGGAFGTKYAITLGGTPVNGNTVFSSTGDQVATVIGTTPYIKTFPWTGSGFGSAYTAPGTVPGNTNYLSPVFSPVNNYLTSGSAVYNWTTSGFGTYAGSVGTPSTTSILAAFNSSASVVVKGMDAFRLSAGAVGTQYSYPSTMPNVDAGGYGSTCFSL